MIAPAEKFSENFIRVQQGLKAPKDKVNNFGKYKYRNAEEILSLLKPILAEVGASIVIDEKIGTVANIPVIKSTAIYADRDSVHKASAFAGIDTNRKGMDIAQSFGASSSYAKKYALCNLFGIDDSANDPDATNDNKDKSYSDKQIPSIEALRSEFIELAEKSKDEKVLACIGKIESFNENQLSIMIKKLRG